MFKPTTLIFYYTKGKLKITTLEVYARLDEENENGDKPVPEPREIIGGDYWLSVYLEKVDFASHCSFDPLEATNNEDAAWNKPAEYYHQRLAELEKLNSYSVTKPVTDYKEVFKWHF